MMEERLFAPFGLDATRVPALGEGWGDMSPSWFGDDPFADASNPTNVGYPLGVAQDTLWEVME